MQVPYKCVHRVLNLAATTLAVFATSSSAILADIHEFEFHGKDTSAMAAGNIDATFRITGDKAGANIRVTAVEIAVIDGAPSATNLFAALGMYKLKVGSNGASFPVSGESLQPITLTIINGRDANLPGNVWKLDVNGKNAALRTHGDAMDVSFKGTIAPKSPAAAVEDTKTMYIIGGIISLAVVGTGAYFFDNYRKRKERRRKRRRSLLVNEPQNDSEKG